MLDSRLSMSLGSAEGHGFFPVVVGFGAEASWAWGLHLLVNKIRDYVFTRTEEDDLVLFFDAWDIVFVAGEDEIVDRYLEMEARMGIELVYSAEERCSYPERQAEFKNTSTPYRYLNSGVYMGRARRFRDLFKDPMTGDVVDKAGKKIRLQNWHIQYYLDNQDSVMLDSGCELATTAAGIDGLYVSSLGPPGDADLMLEGNHSGRIRNTITGTHPLIIHFAGIGHWSDWRHPSRIGSCPAYELFRVAGNAALAKKMEEDYFLSPGFFGLAPWKMSCTSFFTFYDRVAMRISKCGDLIIEIKNSLEGSSGFLVAGMALMALSAALFVHRRRSRLGQTVHDD
mmetsp:Transcript_15515/g.30014  ORF Transcript_15515/g.30014 Transcript_15515/m.30014 type:complete len:340 (+) Transcript_15515:176-1195(+)